MWDPATSIQLIHFSGHRDWVGSWVTMCLGLTPSMGMSSFTGNAGTKMLMILLNETERCILEAADPIRGWRIGIEVRRDFPGVQWLKVHLLTRRHRSGN